MLDNLKQLSQSNDLPKLNEIIWNPKNHQEIEHALYLAFTERSNDVKVWLNIAAQIQEYKSKLLNQHFQEANKVTISGPVSCTILKNENRTIILFGDDHSDRSGKCPSKCNRHDLYLNPISENNKCYTIPALLETWMEYNNKHEIKTDLYLEAEFRKSDVTQLHTIMRTIQLLKQSTHVSGKAYDRVTKSGDLTAIRRSVKESLDTLPYLALADLVLSNELLPSKIKSRFKPYVRVHYADIRTVITSNEREPFKREPVTIFTIFSDQTTKEALDTVLNKLTQGTLYSDDEYKMIIFIVNNFELIKDFYFKGLDYDEFKYEIMDRFRNARLNISDELKRRFTTTIDAMGKLTAVRNRKRYNKSIIQLQKLDEETASKVLNFIETGFDTEVQKLRDNLEMEILLGTGEMFIALKSYIMDIYTLARMLRFKDSEQIIAYTGEFHTRRYIDFFQNVMKYELIEKNVGTTEYKRCVHSHYLVELLNL